MSSPLLLTIYPHRYDAVTTEGKLAWQDGLTRLNEPFYDACDGIFINYTWTEEKLHSTANHLNCRFSDSTARTIYRHNVYFGVDVFGRGCYGGGQCNSHVAVKKLVENNFSGALK
jgi:mannosyl-glycoprotein endo-beta-N-acetylglucosaminidase